MPQHVSSFDGGHHRGVLASLIAAQLKRVRTCPFAVRDLPNSRAHKAESSHDMKALLAGMTSDCFNDVAAVPKPFRGPKRVAERYQKHWAGFPDFKVRVKRLLAVGENAIVTENEWSGTHLGNFLGYPPTGKYVRVRALVVWHFKGKRLWGETVFFDMGGLLKKICARITIPRNRREAKRRD
jgi:steroid delta-isomerase-like uncharacterized protein